MSFLIFRKKIEPGTEILLSQDEIRHTRARRLRAGDLVMAGDGAGKRYHAAFNEKMTGVMIMREEPESRIEPVRIVCTALPSGNRLDWMLQKAAELGATHIIPLVCSRSGRSDFSLKRAEKILMEASVQSERFVLPEIYSPVRLKDSLSFIKNQITDNVNHTYLYTGDSPPFTDVDCGGPVSFFTGPEGDFDDDEFAFFRENGMKSYSLGKTILKVETAVIAALSILSAKSV